MRIQKQALAGATVAIVLLMSGAALAAHHGKRGKKGHHKRFAGMTAVQVASARQASILSEIQFSGVVTPVHTMKLTSPASGTVTNVLVGVGQSVVKGQTLATLSSPLLTAKLSAAQAALTSTEAKLAAAKQPASSATVAQDNLQYQKALLALSQAQSQEQAAQSSHTSTTQISQDQMAVHIAQLSVLATQDVLHASQEAPNTTTLHALQSAVAQAQANLNGIQSEVNQLTITAPFSGLVTTVSGFTGEPVTAGSSVVSLNTSTLQIQSTVPESERNRLRAGQTAWIHWAGASVRGQVSQIAPVTTASLSFPFAVTFASPPVNLWAGETVTANVVMAHTTGVIIPSQAIVNINGRNQVFVVKHHVVLLVNVTPGITNGLDTAVTGISASTPVVTLGQSYLASGDKVRVTSHKTVPGTLTGAAVTGFVSQYTPSTKASKGKKSGKGGGG